MRKTLSKLLPLLTLASLIFTGAGCLGGGTTAQIKPVTLTYWRTEDDPAALNEAISAYQKLHSNVSVNVTRLRSEDYERTLLEALAQNRGPDVFTIPNTWIGGWKTKLQPMPKETTIPTRIAQDGKVVVVNQKSPTLSLIDFNNRFIEGVTRELTTQVVEKQGAAPVTRILALPLSGDTLGLYYNRDIFRRANIENPPKTWRDVQEYAVKLTVFEPLPAGSSAIATPQVIKQSGVAIGLGRNVNHHVDILSALMLQNGAQLADDYGYATFHLARRNSDDEFPPGVEALTFYDSFSIENSQNYSWNALQPNSLDAFITGKTAMYFGFPAEAAVIRERAPGLDFDVAPLPQVDLGSPANILHYPVEVVSRKSANVDVAWDFVQFVAAQPDVVRTFLTATKRPTALRSLIAEQLTDADVGPFAGQVLTAKSWYRGADYGKVEAAFTAMIETRPTFEQPSLLPIMSAGANAVNETMLFQ